MRAIEALPNTQLDSKYAINPPTANYVRTPEFLQIWKAALSSSTEIVRPACRIVECIGAMI